MIVTRRETDYVLNAVSGSVTILELLTYAKDNVNEWISDSVLWDLTDAQMKEDKSDWVAIRTTVSNIDDLVAKRAG